MHNKDKEYFFQIRCAGKRGMVVRKHDEDFLKRMRKLYPEECQEIDGKVYDETKPFGAS